MDKFEKLAVQLGFLTKYGENLFLAHLGCSFKRNLVSSWEKSIKREWKTYSTFDCQISTSCADHRENIIAEQMRLIRDQFCRDSPFCLLSKEATNSGSNDLVLYSTSSEHLGRAMDTWLRKRRSWWLDQTTSIGENFEFTPPKRVEDGAICQYKPFGAAGVVEEIHASQQDTWSIIRCRLSLESSVKSLLHDSVIYENDQAAGFHFVPTLAPFKVVIFNVCGAKFDAVASEMCARLRLSFNVVNVANFYEISAAESLDERWTFYRRLGSCFAVVVDDQTFVDNNCIVTIWHADNNVKQTTSIMAVRWIVLENLGMRSVDDVDLKNNKEKKPA